MTHAAELEDVSKRYGRRLALDGVSFALPPGAAVGLVGANGAGKTSALRLLLGLARPSAGAVRLQGLDPREPAARRGLGYVPERLVLPRGVKVRRFLADHAALAGIEGARRAREIDRVLELTGLSDRGGSRVDELSKGLAQRVGLSQALLGEPRLLILDEPFSGLDVLAVREARGWLADARAAGATVLLCTHVLSEVERICDDVVLIHHGRVIRRGALEELTDEHADLEEILVRSVEGGD